MTETIKEYASALFMLAAENEDTEMFSKCLDTIGTLIKENNDYLSFLNSPAIPLSERLFSIEEAFGKQMPEYIVSFLKLLCENGHIKALNECIEEYRELLRQLKNQAIATVFYVNPLTEAQKSALVQKLERLSKKTIEARYVEDKSLIGGIKIQLDDITLDGSLSAKLSKVKGVMEE